jgi:hypothetical protein
MSSSYNNFFQHFSTSNTKWPFHRRTTNNAESTIRRNLVGAWNTTTKFSIILTHSCVPTCTHYTYNHISIVSLFVYSKVHHQTNFPRHESLFTHSRVQQMAFQQHRPRNNSVCTRIANSCDEPQLRRNTERLVQTSQDPRWTRCFALWKGTAFLREPAPWILVLRAR